MVAAVNAREQGTELPRRGRPPTDHDLMPDSALGLGPVIGASGPVGCIELFRDDPFKRKLASRPQNRVAPALEMLDISDERFASGVSCLEERLQLDLALTERLRRQVCIICKKKIERVEDQIVCSLLRQGSLQRREIGCAIAVEGYDLAVDDAIRQRRRYPPDRFDISPSSRGLCVFLPRPFHLRREAVRDSRRT